PVESSTSRWPYSRPVPAGELPPNLVENRCEPSAGEYSARAVSLVPMGVRTDPPRFAGPLKTPDTTTPTDPSATPYRNTDEADLAHRIEPGAGPAPASARGRSATESSVGTRPPVPAPARPPPPLPAVPGPAEPPFPAPP